MSVVTTSGAVEGRTVLRLPDGERGGDLAEVASDAGDAEPGAEKKPDRLSFDIGDPFAFA